MSIPSAAYKVPLLTVLSALGANMPGAQELVEKFEQAVREEEFKKAEAAGVNNMQNICSWPDKTCPDECPAKGTRYCE